MSTSVSTRVIRVGLLGFGTVGQGTYRMLTDNASSLESKTGARIEVARIGIRDAAKPRGLGSEKFTTDLESIVDDPSIDVIIEVMGGEEPAATLVERALDHKKPVVTANKELLAKHGSRLITKAKNNGIDLHFEAAVGGGIPVVQPLKHQLAGNDVIQLMGILNGTTNYILTKMDESGAEFADALGEAQRLGYAEADPTNDVDGIDTMYKISILAAIVFGKQINLASVHREGIRKVSMRDMHYARILGYTIKLLGIVEHVEPDGIMVRVHPTLLPKDHQLAAVHDVYNAVWIHGDFVGDLMFSGRGAGGDPTASAVVGDLVDVVRNNMAGGQGSAIPYGPEQKTVPIADLKSRYYVRIEVKDTPGTLGQVATIFGNHGVGLAAMEMRPKEEGLGEIVFMTHTSREGDFVTSMEDVGSHDSVTKIENWMRVQS